MLQGRGRGAEVDNLLWIETADESMQYARGVGITGAYAIDDSKKSLRT